MDWEWYNIIPARISLISSLLVILHIIYHYYYGYIHLKPFHITSLLICLLDLIQDIGYAIPLSCHYSISFLLFGCLNKAIIIPGFIFYLYILLSHPNSILNKTLLFSKFLLFTVLSFILSLLSLLILSLYGNYFNNLCDSNQFTNHIQSPIEYTTPGYIFLFTIIIPCTIGYIIFIYFIICIISKIGINTIYQVSNQMFLRFLLGLIIFTIGMIPGIYILLLYIFNIQSNKIYTECVKISGICCCSLGFLYAIFYSLNIPIRVTTSQHHLSTHSKDTNFGELVHQPLLSIPIIISENYRFSSTTTLSLIHHHHPSDILPNLSSPSIATNNGSKISIRLSELPLMKLSFYDNQEFLQDGDI